MRSLPAHLHALFLTLCGVLWFFSPPAAADHWPARKYDAGRSGASNDILPEKLVRIWEYDFHLQLEEEPSAEDAEPPPQKTPEELRDAITHSNLFFEETERSLPRTNTGEEIYEPIVQGETVILIHPDTGRVTALNADDGEVKWEQTLEATIRFMPVATENETVIVACDDGTVHCLTLSDGTPQWEFDAVAALRRKSSQLTESTTMPIAKGPVVLGGKLYFAIGGWPFSGVFLFDVTITDVPPGETPTYQFLELSDRRQRGYLAAAGDKLFISQGSEPAIVLNAATSDLDSLQYDTLSFVGHDLSTAGNWLIQGDHLVDLSTMHSERIGPGGGIFREAELATELFFAQGKRIVGVRLFGGARYTAISESQNAAPTKTVLWQIDQQAIFDTFSDVQKERWVSGNLRADIVVGGKVFGRWGNAVFAANIPDEGETPEVSWSTVIDAVPISLAAAGNKLFVMTVEGKLIVLSMEDAIHGSEIIVNPQEPVTEKKRSPRCSLFWMSMGRM
jgi:outer membrane protein assembly factor BamB